MTPDEAAARSWTWQDGDGTASNDWAEFEARLLQVARRRGFTVEDLGPVEGRPLRLLSRPGGAPGRPRVLLSGGFHGEEPAGPWGLLSFLDTAADDLLAAVELTLLPLVNVTGFVAGRRLNDWGENPNRGFLPGAERPSREGTALLRHGDRLAAAARDGLVTCHEDVLLSHAYLYTLERSDAPGAFSRSLLEANAAFFPVHPDGEVDGCTVRSGIVFNHRDTSFENWLFDRGARQAACVETPGQQPFPRRVAAQAAMARVFVEHVVTPSE